MNIMATYGMLRTRDGLWLSGGSSHDVVEQLRSESRTPCETMREFMLATARNATEQVGVPVDGSTCDSLVGELIGLGLLEEIE